MNEKHSPEVGDVWIHKKQGRPMYITDVGGNYISFLSYTIDEFTRRKCKNFYTNTFCGLHDDERYTRFTEIYKYLGKSKGKIEELFEVEKENNENEKDKLANDLKQIVRDSAKQAREIIDNWNKGV